MTRFQGLLPEESEEEEDFGAYEDSPADSAPADEAGASPVSPPEIMDAERSDTPSAGASGTQADADNDEEDLLDM